MEAKDIIKPENLVYQKSRLMAENSSTSAPVAVTALLYAPLPR